VFEDKLQKSLAALTTAHPDRVHVPPARQFIGLDGYEKVIESCDVVLLCSTPAFRPQHLRRAVEAGRHVFTEKPAATDAPGVRSTLESAALAKRKGLALKSGFNWRHDFARREFHQRILDGAIGDIRAIYATYYVSVLQPITEERKPGVGDLEWQLRHWYQFFWLSGDGYVEQTVHAVDWLMWTMRDVPPLKCVAVGGRQTPGTGGNIYDHIEANYEWPGGVRCFVGARQQKGCFNDTSLYLMGTKGLAEARRHMPAPVIHGPVPWTYAGPKNLMHQTEHDDLFASIRAGKPVNDGERMAHSTLAAIMGRMAAYTGQEITWDMAMNSKDRLVPEKLDWNMPLPVAPMAQPGITKFS
jgi:predicted dehydrogenase